MSWFDDQIRQRKQKDQEIFEDSIFRMASVVLGKRNAGSLNDQRIVTKAAIDEILKFYGIKPGEIPDNLEDAEEQLEYCLRPHGIMRRNVQLEEGWYRDAFGPMLGFYGPEQIPVALLPNSLVGYHFLDPASGEKRALNKETAALFSADAICFYRPLPLKKLGIPDLLAYLRDCLSAGDVLALAALTLLATLVGTVQGGIQAVSRSYFGKLIPKKRSNEFFGFFDIFGKFASVLGPFLYAVIGTWTGRSSFGVLALIALFLIGLFIMIGGKKHFEALDTAED